MTFGDWFLIGFAGLFAISLFSAFHAAEMRSREYQRKIRQHYKEELYKRNLEAWKDEFKKPKN